MIRIITWNSFGVEIAFNIVVSNCDDHSRNHGFILTTKGWQLSPAYDINPDENGMGLKLNISEDDNSLDFDLAIGVAKYFSLDKKRSEEILNEIKSVVSGWQKYATECGISRTEQELVAGAFRYYQSTTLRISICQTGCLISEINLVIFFIVRIGSAINATRKIKKSFNRK